MHFPIGSNTLVKIRKAALSAVLTTIGLVVKIVHDNPEIIDTTAGKLKIGGTVAGILLVGLTKKAVEKYVTEHPDGSQASNAQTAGVPAGTPPGVAGDNHGNL